jgi:rhodanese-related sulfurtransferase
MDQLLVFVTNHPYLVGAFAVLFALFVRNEMSRGGATVSAQQLVQLVNSEDAVVIDVRDKGEFDEGHIVGAINVPHANLDARLDELKKYKDKPVVIACKMGQHSGTAGTILRKAGFENVSRLRGGITEWRGQSLPVVKA